MGTSDLVRGYYILQVYFTYVLKWTGFRLGSLCSDHIRSGKMGKSDTVRNYFVGLAYCTYELKWKPLFDGWAFGVLNI